MCVQAPWKCYFCEMLRMLLPPVELASSYYRGCHDQQLNHLAVPCYDLLHSSMYMCLFLVKRLFSRGVCCTVIKEKQRYPSRPSSRYYFLGMASSLLSQGSCPFPREQNANQAKTARQVCECAHLRVPAPMG